ncbi:MAG TPA: FtsX-like permease family protein [Vicinamibacterales bacterium]|nr:FtsX-like permease family protein [Vicinamibacterales bacterium]
MNRAAAIARRLLDLALPDQHRDVVLTHLDEEYAHVMRTQSPRSARRWYWRQVTGSLPGAMQMRMQSPRSDRSRSNSVAGRLSRFFREFLHDARYGLRQLRQAPGFSIAAVLMLAIGLGLVAGSYTVVNGIFIRGWDVPDSKNVFRAFGSVTGAPEGGRIDDGLSYGAYKHFREHGKAADYVAFLYQNRRLGTSQATAVYSNGWLVSDNFIEAMQIPMGQGPGFTGTKTSDGARVVMSDKLWKTAFDGDPSLVGRSIWVSGMPATVVGITAPGFGSLGERTIDFMVEISASPLWAMRGRPDNVAEDKTCCVSVAGRVRPGRSLTQVREELTLLTAQYRQATSQPELMLTLRDTSPIMADQRRVATTFALIGAAVILVWGLTCANVGNLFLARSLKRHREIAVRLALGASRARLVRQLLAEGLVLAALAGSIALGLAAGVPIVAAKLDGTAARFAPDVLVVAVGSLATIVTCLLVALAPALYATRINWKGAGRTSTVRPGRLREVVLAVQIGVATVLVLSATLIGRGIMQASTSRADFALHSTTAVEFQLPPTATDGQREAARLGLRAAADGTGGEYGLAESVPVSDRVGLQTTVRPISGRVEYRARLLQMSSTAFQILDIPFVEGRPASDVPGRLEAVINHTLAQRIWADEGALGQTLHLGFDDTPYTIVGVTRDAHLTSLGEVEPLIHTSHVTSRLGFVLARTAPGLREKMTALAKSVDPTLTVRLIPLSEAVQSSLKFAFTGAAAASGLAVVALLLAVIGVFGVFSYLIEERRREIGIRLALGATKSQVRTALARASRRPVVMGVVLGLVLSIVAGTLLRGFLFGLSPLDPVSYLIVTAVLLAAAIVATAAPVRRALRVDPAVTLRAE